MKYGEIALGVECALPRVFAARRPGAARRLIDWMASALRRWG
jgi:hypothetical protein